MGERAAHLSFHEPAADLEQRRAEREYERAARRPTTSCRRPRRRPRRRARVSANDCTTNDRRSGARSRLTTQIGGIDAIAAEHMVARGVAMTDGSTRAGARAMSAGMRDRAYQATRAGRATRRASHAIATAGPRRATGTLCVPRAAPGTRAAIPIRRGCACSGVSQKYVPETQAGTEITLHAILRELQARGHDTRALGDVGPRARAGRRRHPGVRERRRRLGARPVRSGPTSCSRPATRAGRALRAARWRTDRSRSTCRSATSPATCCGARPISPSSTRTSSSSSTRG